MDVDQRSPNQFIFGRVVPRHEIANSQNPCFIRVNLWLKTHVRRLVAAQPRGVQSVAMFLVTSVLSVPFYSYETASTPLHSAGRSVVDFASAVQHTPQPPSYRDLRSPPRRSARLWDRRED